MPSYSSQINSVLRAPSLWMPHCLESASSAPKALLIANQLQKVIMTTSKKYQDSKREIHEFPVKSVLQRQGQTNVQQAHAVIFRFTNKCTLKTIKYHSAYTEFKRIIKIINVVNVD